MIFKISKENKNYNNYKNNILSLICDSHDDTLEQQLPKRVDEENNKEEGNSYFKSIKKTSNIFNSIKANNNNNNNIILQQFSPSTTPSSLSRSESPANNSKNFTECDADLNIFTNDSIDQFDKNKNLLDKLIDTVNKMKEELGIFYLKFYLLSTILLILREKRFID